MLKPALPDEIVIVPNVTGGLVLVSLNWIVPVTVVELDIGSELNGKTNAVRFTYDQILQKWNLMLEKL